MNFSDIIAILKNHKTILYPTDTVWGIGCDASSEIAVQKIYEIKNRSESKALIILVSSIEMLKNYVDIPDLALKILPDTTRPTTVIYNNPRNLAQNLINSSDNTIAIRIVQDEFCKNLIEKFGKAIVSTSANISNNPTPTCFNEISATILKKVDFTVDLHRNKICTKSSTILKIDNDTISVIRA